MERLWFNHFYMERMYQILNPLIYRNMGCNLGLKYALGECLKLDPHLGGGHRNMTFSFGSNSLFGSRASLVIQQLFETAALFTHDGGNPTME